MNKLKLLVSIAFAILVLFSGCTSYDAREKAIEECVYLCQQTLKEGADLRNGPCLSDNNSQWGVSDWVCDVAHFPRQPIDNVKENQCRDFYEGRAHHFVEVNEQCEVIRVV